MNKGPHPLLAHTSLYVSAKFGEESGQVRKLASYLGCGSVQDAVT